MMKYIKLFEESHFPHEIKSERYWRQILAGNDYALKVLDTVMLKQGGRASDRQMQIMRRVESGDRSRYSTKNESIDFNEVDRIIQSFVTTGLTKVPADAQKKAQSIFGVSLAGIAKGSAKFLKDQMVLMARDLYKPELTPAEFTGLMQGMVKAFDSHIESEALRVKQNMNLAQRGIYALVPKDEIRKGIDDNNQPGNLNGTVSTFLTLVKDCFNAQKPEGGGRTDQILNAQRMPIRPITVTLDKGSNKTYEIGNWTTGQYYSDRADAVKNWVEANRFTGLNLVGRYSNLIKNIL